MIRLLLICLGGAVGTGARYLIGSWALRLLGPAFPFGTLTVNVLGSFLIAVVMQIALASGTIGTTARLVLTAGFLGGFTTYSAFNYETLRFIEDGAWAMGLLNVAGTVLGCLVAGVLGLALGKWIVAG